MSARDELFRRVAGAFVNEDRANKLIDKATTEARNEGFQSGRRTGRTDALLEAVTVTRAELLLDNTGTSDDEAYNQGVRDAVAAIERLLKDGAQ
ncbi:hypothetical protein ABT034_33790 [Streptomyces sp. NPDC002773]|uniref:hypothetical protein n=1 Tax=Streptomyces sp. NPDC002773 TaxID=3154430 RepID=UPI00333490D5